MANLTHKMSCGDNINSVHLMRMRYNDESIVVAHCERCKRNYTCHPKTAKYRELFRRDTLQPSGNLYYKEFIGKMSIAS